MNDACHLAAPGKSERPVKSHRPTFFREARLTLLLGIPMMAGQLSQMLMGVADTVMVGRVGIFQLAAASFASVVLMLFYIVGIGFQIPVSILTSHAHGRTDGAETGQIFRHGLFIAIATGIVIACLSTVTSFFLGHFGQDPRVIALATPYLQIVAWSLLPAMLEQCFKQFSEALHRPWRPMLIMLSAVGLNVFLNWVLIYGHLGAPALGLAGAGWATLISRWVSVAGLLLVVLRGADFRNVLPTHWVAPLEWGRFTNMAKLGAPLAASLLLEVGSFSAAAMMMGWISAKTLAAHQIAMNVAATTFMIPLGLSFAARIRVGHALGSGHHDRLQTIGFSAMGLGTAFMGTSAIIIWLFGGHIAGWFVRENDVVALAATLLSAAAVFQIFDGIQVIAGGSLNGLADVRIPTLTAFVAYWVIALPLAYYLGFVRRLGGAGIWWALALGLALAAIFGMSRFWFLTKKAAA